MPNPRHGRRWPDVPLDEHVGYVSHVVVVCGRPRGDGRCAHQVVMATRMLYQLAPGAVTVADFQRRMLCRSCGGKGWAQISAAGR